APQHRDFHTLVAAQHAERKQGIAVIVNHEDAKPPRLRRRFRFRRRLLLGVFLGAALHVARGRQASKKQAAKTSLEHILRCSDQRWVRKPTRSYTSASVLDATARALSAPRARV